MKPEEKARREIDKQLEEAGWLLQEYKDFNPKAALGVAVREFPLGIGFADYLLLVNGNPLGVVEAKPKGTTLSGVYDQSKKYLSAFEEKFEYMKAKPLFTYETTGIVTFFADLRDPNPRSRRVFTFHQPKTLLEWSKQEKSLRGKLQELPPLDVKGLRDCQIQAITNLEKSFHDGRPRSLIQMATGSGKTYTAVSFGYRLIKFAKAKRILFLVDRSNLGRQTNKEFQQYITPDDGRKFTELYNVEHLTTNTIDSVSKICITTIQRLYSMLRGEKEYEDELEEKSLFQIDPLREKASREVVYNPEIPIETFDFIVTDECHRSIYNLWRQVLEYFDSFIIGLTATPAKHTLGFFNQNLVTEYAHDRAVADGVNVDYDVYRIKTKITEKGSKVEAGEFIDKRDKLTRKKRWEILDEELKYTARELDRSVVAVDQIRLVIKTFKEKLFTEIFPGRKDVPKTLVFAKDDSHAEDIVGIIREEFGKGNEFCKKITYKSGEKPEDLIASFRNSYPLRIVVTVDMISTGTDIKPLECLLFMRDVKSRVYFEQMKGRGTRTISSTDFQQVTMDAKEKTHFVIVDAVGVCESDKTDSRPLERKRSIKFDKLMNSIVYGNRENDTISSLASRLSRLNNQIDEKSKKELLAVTKDKPLKEIINGLLDSIDPDIIEERAKEEYNTDKPTKKQKENIEKKQKEAACAIFYEPKVRNKIIEIKTRNEQTIDKISKDEILFAGHDDKARERAKTIIDTFKKFIVDNKNELTALQIFYSKPYGQRKLTFKQIKELAEAIEKPPYRLSTEQLWQAYEQLHQAKVKRVGTQKLLTNIISLIRFELGDIELLEPFSEEINHRFNSWLEEQEESNRKFTDEQKEWLVLIKNHIISSLSIEESDFQYAPFFEKGGQVKANRLFNNKLNAILVEINEVLIS